MSHRIGNGASENVTLSGITPGPRDWPIERANYELRTALLNQPAVIEHVEHLHVLRSEWQSSPNRGKWRETSLPGLLIDAALPELRRYETAVESSPLRDFFSTGQLEHLAKIAPERIAAGLWGKLIPVNDLGAGYGREKQRARAMTPESIRLAVDDFVERLAEPEGAEWLSCPRCSALPGDPCAGGRMHAARVRAARPERPGVSDDAVRKVRQRARQLPYL